MAAQALTSSGRCRRVVPLTLLAWGCADAPERLLVTVDLGACVRLEGQPAGEPPATGACGATLKELVGAREPLCIAATGIAEPAVTGAWWDLRTGLVTAAQRAAQPKARDGERLALQVFVLAAEVGDPAEACQAAEFSRGAPCHEAPGCVLATGRVHVALRSTGATDVAWGPEGHGCGFECAHEKLCGAAAGPAREVPCNRRDDDCDGRIDEVVVPERTPGARCDTGRPGECAEGAWDCVDGLLECVGRRAPTAERCSGLDDDCDGEVDEDLTAPPCGPREGVCEAARVARRCRGKDDWSDCRLGVEHEPGGETRCDGLDNDCDGEVDTGLIPPACDLRGGVCAPATDARRCQGDGGWTACDYGDDWDADGEVRCDGLDNDCDGEIDEDDAGGGEGCETGRPGVCAAGTRHCEGGELACRSDTPPGLELPATDIDEDCDGTVDEGFATLQFPGRDGAAAEMCRDRSLQLDATSFTVEAWVRPAAFDVSRFSSVVSRRSLDTATGWALGLTGAAVHGGRAARSVVFLVGDWPEQGAGQAAVGAHAEIEAGGWHHVAATFALEGGGEPGAHAVTVFLDGATVGREPLFRPALPDFMPGTATLLGDDVLEDSAGFAGELAQVRVSLGVRYGAGDRCEALGTACFEPERCLGPDAETVAAWPLDEGRGEQLRDEGAQALHGRVIGRAPGETWWAEGARCAQPEDGP